MALEAETCGEAGHPLRHSAERKSRAPGSYPGRHETQKVEHDVLNPRIGLRRQLLGSRSIPGMLASHLEQLEVLGRVSGVLERTGELRIWSRRRNPPGIARLVPFGLASLEPHLHQPRRAKTGPRTSSTPETGESSFLGCSCRVSPSFQALEVSRFSSPAKPLPDSGALGKSPRGGLVSAELSDGVYMSATLTSPFCLSLSHELRSLISCLISGRVGSLFSSLPLVFLPSSSLPPLVAVAGRLKRHFINPPSQHYRALVQDGQVRDCCLGGPRCGCAPEYQPRRLFTSPRRWYDAHCSFPLTTARLKIAYEPNR